VKNTVVLKTSKVLELHDRLLVMKLDTLRLPE